MTRRAARKKNERKLVESGRRKDEFLAIMAHELYATPLGAIKSAVSILESPEVDDHLAWGRDVSTPGRPFDPPPR